MGLTAILTVPGATLARELPFKVLPWNGYKGALSMTYDDGDPVHLDLVIPEMNKRKLRGTFFLIVNPLTRSDEWKSVAASGHELGNHTLTHRHVSELSPEDEKNEVAEARTKIEELAGKPVLGFAYPFVEISDGLRKWVGANSLVARGGGGADMYMTPDLDPDWLNIPSQTTMTATPFEIYQGWVDQALARGAWTVLMIHGIEGSNLWQPVPKETYLQLLDYVSGKSRDLWVAPFSEVGAYWKAQKTLEAAVPEKKTAKAVLRWKKPEPFPKDVVLKLRIEGEGLKVTQKGKAVLPDESGSYPVRFDDLELTLQNAAWKTVVRPPTPTPTPNVPGKVDFDFPAPPAD